MNPFWGSAPRLFAFAAACGRLVRVCRGGAGGELFGRGDWSGTAYVPTSMHPSYRSLQPETRAQVRVCSPR